MKPDSQILCAAYCDDCDGDVLYLSAGGEVPTRALCPVCAERDGAVRELSVALQLLIASRQLADEAAVANQTVASVAQSLKELAGVLRRRHP